jgi:NAD-dependent deacetylase
MEQAMNERERALNILANMSNGLVLTGAGISVPSGIPDFRSKIGLWSENDPEYAASIDGFLKSPQTLYDWFSPFHNLVDQAKPNIAHLTLCELERQGKINRIITQNIDRMHQKSCIGSSVIELHGNIVQGHCSMCAGYAKGLEWSKKLKKNLESKVPPKCDVCGYVLKPDIVLFGESLNEELLSEAVFMSRSAQILLVVGTSLKVHPFNSIIEHFHASTTNTEKKCIYVNLEEPPIDMESYIDLFVKDDCASFFSDLMEMITKSAISKW